MLEITKKALEARLEVLSDSYQRALDAVRQANEHVQMHKGAIGEINSFINDLTKAEADAKAKEPTPKVVPLDTKSLAHKVKK